MWQDSFKEEMNKLAILPATPAIIGASWAKILHQFEAGMRGSKQAKEMAVKVHPALYKRVRKIHGAAKEIQKPTVEAVQAYEEMAWPIKARYLRKRS